MSGVGEISRHFCYKRPKDDVIFREDDVIKGVKNSKLHVMSSLESEVRRLWHRI